MPIRMTKTARAQNLKNGLIWGIGFLVAWCSLTLVFGPNTGDWPGLGSVYAWSVLLVFFGKWIYNQSIGGKVLLDCGTYPDKWWVCLAAIVFFLVVEPCAAFAPMFSWNLTLIVVLAAAGMLIAGFGRLQVWENGIWDRAQSTPLGQDPFLQLGRGLDIAGEKKELVFSPQGQFPIPPEQNRLSMSC